MQNFCLVYCSPTVMLCVWAEQWQLLFTYFLSVVYKLFGTFFGDSSIVSE